MCGSLAIQKSVFRAGSNRIQNIQTETIVSLLKVSSLVFSAFLTQILGIVFLPSLAILAYHYDREISMNVSNRSDN